MTKKCRSCSLVKQLDQFCIKPDSLHGVNSRCKECVAKYTREYRKLNPDRRRDTYARSYTKNKEKIRLKRIEKVYGLTVHSLNTLIRSQDNKCAICKNTFIDTKTMHVDHSHNSGKVRGLLCSKCNKAIGLFQESTTSLNNAIKYLSMYDKS